MLYVAICDDNLQISRQIEQYLLEISRSRGIGITIELFEDGLALETEIMEGTRYDMIYLDIQMKYKDGIETAQAIRQIDKTVILIYVSSFISYAIQTFAVRPFRFIVKPINQRLFQQYFLAAYEEIIESHTYFEYDWNKVRYRIPVKDIVYFESKLRVVEIVLPQERKQTYKKLDIIEKQLQKTKITFLRIHKSYLINMLYVEAIRYDEVMMKGGEVLQISKNRRKEISFQYCNLTEDEYD